MSWTWEGAVQIHIPGHDEAMDVEMLGSRYEGWPGTMDR